MKFVKVQRRKSDVVIGVPKELHHLLGKSQYLQVEEVDGKLCYSKIER